MILVGDIVKTNYARRRPFRVVSISRGCTCPDYINEISMDDPPPRPPHIHLICVAAETPLRKSYHRHELYWLSGYAERDDGRITSIDNDGVLGPGHLNAGEPDELFIIGSTSGAQLELFQCTP